MTLKSRSVEIKEETVKNANTAIRVGGLLEDMTQQQPLVGFFDYNHGSGTQEYTSGDLFLINDGTGINTNKAFAPEGITDVWDSTLNQFSFSDLSLGDTIDLRLDLSITTTSPNQTVNTALRLGYGQAGSYDIPFTIDNQVKSVGTVRFVVFNSLYMGDVLTRDNPAKFVFKSDQAATITVSGWYVRIFKKSK